MNQSTDLIARFVDATRDTNPYKGETTAYGTIVVHGESTYVRLDGSDLLTPVVYTTDVSDGDRVIVSLKNHTATVTSNISDPAIGRKRADGMESNITQTAEQIRLEVKNEVAQLEASITLTATEIRSELSDEVTGLNSSITQTAADIRSEISDMASGLESKITQNANSITTVVKKQDEFSEFKQTVEGFSFMNKGGTVKIGHGDINLTGTITFSDLSDDVETKINNASTTASSALTTANNASSSASTAIYNAGVAISQSNSAKAVADEAKALAASMQLPSYLKSTYIDKTTVMSPTIVGGTFYAMGQTAWTTMASDGLRIYTGGISTPKISMINDNEDIEITLGAGTHSGLSRFYIQKTTNKASIMYITSSGNSCGFYFNDNGEISVVGTLVQ